jgi:hypothetical protein
MAPPERVQDQDSSDTSVSQEKKEDGQQRGTLRSHWKALPKVWKILTVTLTPVATLFGILGPLGIISPSPPPLQPSGYFQGYILGPTGLPVRKMPRLSGPIVATLQPGTNVFIVCTRRGDAVTGPRHGGGIIKTRVWDSIRTATSAGQLGFVPDALVETGSTKPTAHPC